MQDAQFRIGVGQRSVELRWNKGRWLGCQLYKSGQPNAQIIDEGSPRLISSFDPAASLVWSAMAKSERIGGIPIVKSTNVLTYFSWHPDAERRREASTNSPLTEHQRSRVAWIVGACPRHEFRIDCV